MINLSKDELFRILSNSRRRYIIYYLHEAGDEMSLKQLAARIAAVENGTSVEDVTDEERQRVYISLYQTHLPKLEEAGIVSYDDEERIVALTDEIANEGFFWMQTDEESRSWATYYAALGVVGWLAILARAVALPVFATLPWFAIAALISTALLALVGAQYLTESGDDDTSNSFETLIE
ncbi:helix-turn-helix domain-containing protein [Halogeometricum sp. S1BR25-6]|uniref:Helix-turn-helix domain-containing protein n=1 Tax=Halogeometricum salsisoli TaxID=2950536 RepID=A0ABU2GJ48_9EURY|nr:transcriptional regulator [Halogeometricum sp. S1BR25-6]MDS0300441.1 helix-turn-helix domain-containing protein [Halogeometricum sp. S1BR25-6]